MALVANFRSAASALLQRYQWARQAGMTFGGKRDMWGVLGYPEIAGLTATDFMDRYERGGIAGRVVDVLPDGTWRGEMWLQEDEDPNKNTPFEETWEELERRLMIRSRFHQTDVLSRLSTYAVLLIGTADGDMEKPLPKGSPDKLLYLQPYLGSGGPTNGNGRSNGQAQSFEADVTIAEYDLDTKSARFALPLFYTLRRPNLSVEMFQRPIHWSRVIHVADGALRDDIFGRPALARIWNHLEDLDKVVGGGSEAFWIRANGGLHLNVDKDLTLNADAQAELKKLGEQAEEYQHQLTRMIRTRGVEVNQLGSDVANFQSPADVLITLIAGSVGIPKRLLVGSEQGELASSQDRENFRDLIGGRQANFAGPKIVRALVDRLIEFNYLPKPKEYKVMWPTIEVMSETEKSTGAQGWASVNSSMQKTVFTEDEIRDRWAGLKPLTDEQKAALEEENAKKQEEQQALAVAQNPGLKEEEKKKKGKAKGFPPKGGFPRAAEAAAGDAEIVRILEAALETGEGDIVAEIIGLGGAGSGNFGHSGRPGQIGGSGGGSGGGAALSKPVSEYRREIARDLWEISDSRSTSHRRSFLQQRAVRDFDELANSVENTPTIRTIRSAFVDDVKDMADDRSTDHRREFSYRRSSARLEELVQEIEPLKSLGGAGSGNFGHAGRPGQVGGSGGSKGVAQTMQREFEQGAQYRNSDYVEATRESPHGGHEFGVRYYGKWRVPPGEDDDGDYDWEEMTPDTAAKVDKLVQSYQEKNPELKIQWSTGEKNWLYVSVKDKLKTLGGTEFRALWPDSTGADDHGRGETTHEQRQQRIKDIDQEIRAISIGPNDARSVKMRMRKIGPLVEEQELHKNVLDPTRHEAITASSKAKRRDDGGYSVEHDGQEIGTLEPVTFTGFKTVNSAQQMTHREGFNATYGGVNVATNLKKKEGIAEVARAHSKALRMKTLGGPGSGNFGHAGRPGQIGGSSASVGGIGQPASVYTPMFTDGRDTKEKFSDGKGHYTPERERLHEEIIRKMMKGTTPVEHPTSTILGGGPGVGKSTIQAREGIGAENTVLVNPDEIRNELPEYAADEHGRRPPLTAFTHEEASDISAKLIKRAANENRNIVLDGTGDSTIEKLGGKVAVLRAKGHKVEATYVTTTVAIAQARSDERGKRIGRMVPPSDMQHMHRQVSLIYPEAIKQGLFDKSQLFDSSEGSARLVASSVGKVLTVHNEALWMSFLAKGHAR